MSPTASDVSVSNLCRYRVKPGKEQEFLAQLRRHWQTLRKAGLATERPATVYRCQDKAGNVAFVEMFSWVTPEAIQAAHQSPAVMAVWEPMGALCEDMEFWQSEPLDLARAAS